MQIHVCISWWCCFSTCHKYPHLCSDKQITWNGKQDQVWWKILFWACKSVSILQYHCFYSTSSFISNWLVFFICLSIYLSTISIYLSIYLQCLSVYLSIYLFILSDKFTIIIFIYLFWILWISKWFLHHWYLVHQWFNKSNHTTCEEKL